MFTFKLYTTNYNHIIDYKIIIMFTVSYTESIKTKVDVAYKGVVARHNKRQSEGEEGLERCDQ